MRTVTISKALYEKLKYRSEFLSYLMEYGVEEWIGYENAKRAFEEEEEQE